jgi:putative membrane protein
VAERNDPRVYFAAERTLLAWVRTGLTVIGLGFVLARFNLFLRTIRPDQVGETHHVSTLLGIGLVLLGSAAIAMAAWQHVHFMRHLEADERPRSYLLYWSVWFAGSIAVIGVVLAVYIGLRSNPA